MDRQTRTKSEDQRRWCAMWRNQRAIRTYYKRQAEARTASYQALAALSGDPVTWLRLDTKARIAAERFQTACETVARTAKALKEAE